MYNINVKNGKNGYNVIEKLGYNGGYGYTYQDWI
jgi:hypothetical protein